MSAKADHTPVSIHAASCWPRVAVVGAGAVGGYFGGLLARAGTQVTMIGRPVFVESVNRGGLHLDTLTFKDVVRVKASSDMHDAHGADIVLFCVKTTDTLATAKALAPFLAPKAILLSLQNGVENVALIHAATKAMVLPSVVYLAASVPEPGHVKHTGRGDLVIGSAGDESARLATLFRQAGIPCQISEHIEGDMWEKFICNCALNAISALCQKTYGEISEHPESWALAEAVIKEALQIAHAVNITPRNMNDATMAIETVRKLTRQIAPAYSSTAHDLRREKHTEIDSLNGFIAHQGRKLGISVPVNQTLFSLIKSAESQPLTPRFTELKSCLK